VAETVTYEVPDVHCEHCESAIRREVEAVEGVEAVTVDLEQKVVAVSGDELDDTALRAAIDEAGYDVA
jgi:copper chaperone